MFIVNPMTNGEFFLSKTNEGFEVSKEITEEVYNKLEANRKLGKMYKIKTFEGKTFEEIFLEYVPDVIEQENKLSVEDYLLDHEYRISKMELGV